ncbi:cephalosporin hydroxylase [Candidatus Saccharibacteria bacterium]|nr:cephalosporin hydroxylase [Candidatus Saccharibacteria bacterium]
MTAKDDRLEFESQTISQSHRLGKDKQVFSQATETLISLDQYDYPYLWSWMGVPIIQLPADIIATQEAIWKSKPDVIIETGVARGGSVIFLASMLEMIKSKGFVIGVDIDLRQHNKETIKEHQLSHKVKLVSGSSVDKNTIRNIEDLLPEKAKIMVILDSDHSRDHVLDELRIYSKFCTKGCYLVIADTILGHLNKSQAPKKRSQLLYQGNEPLAARDIFLAENDRFEIDKTLNGKLVLSSSPGGYLKCVKEAY